MMTMMNILNVNLHGQRRRGLQIGDYLVILPYPYGHPTQRKIYNLCAKKPIHNTVLSHNLAVEIAKNYEKTYRDYFCLWQEYPDMVIHNVVQYTIPHGQQLAEHYEALFR
jgi:hypothetical protein